MKSPATCFNVDELDDLLEKYIKQSVEKTNEIIGRQQWIKNETMSRGLRVGHFVTTLRRELSPLIAKIPDDFGMRWDAITFSPGNLKSFLTKLYNTEMWDDVGVPKLYGKWGGGEWNFSCTEWKMDNNKISEICKSAATVGLMEESVEDINKSLASLQRDMYPLRIGIETLHRLNAESDKIAQNLCAIVEGK